MFVYTLLITDGSVRIVTSNVIGFVTRDLKATIMKWSAAANAVLLGGILNSFYPLHKIDT